MVTNNEIKQVRALLQKKYRIQQRRFVVEGVKITEELLESGFKVIAMYVTAEHTAGIPQELMREVTKDQMSRMSGMNTPPGVLAVAELPDRKMTNDYSGWSIVLDDVRDPGNMGTILRIADWFGLQRIISSTNSVDPYNPKVVQSSMGAIFRVPVFETNIANWLIEAREQRVKIFAADMQGTPIGEVDFEPNGVLIMGSESHGINEALKSFIDQPVTIPGKGGAESLNVAVAMGIICSRLPI